MVFMIVHSSSSRYGIEKDTMVIKLTEFVSLCALNLLLFTRRYHLDGLGTGEAEEIVLDSSYWNFCDSKRRLSFSLPNLQSL